MSCNNQNYFIGQGKVMMRSLGDGCAAATEAFFEIGDADVFSISPTTTFIEHYESQSGLRKKALRVQDTQDKAFTLGIKNISAKNLSVLLAGTDSGSVAAGSVVDEVIAVASLGTVYTAFQGITSVVVTSNSGVTTLVLDTDYTVDSRNGGITLIDLANVTANSIEVDYAHVGRQFSVNALQSLSGDYELRFNAINRSEPNTPWIIKILRGSISTADELSLIGSDVMSLSFTGEALDDANGDSIVIEKSNTVV